MFDSASVFLTVNKLFQLVIRDVSTLCDSFQHTQNAIINWIGIIICRESKLKAQCLLLGYSDVVLA